MPDREAQLRPPPRLHLNRLETVGSIHRGRHRAGSTPTSRRRLVLAAIVDRLPSTLQTARIAPGRRAVIGALVAVVAVVGILGVRLAMASAEARAVPVATSSGSGPASPSASAPASTSDAPAALPHDSPALGVKATSTAASGSLVVYVSGRVRHPGVVTVPSGSRVQDALRAAGGALPRSDLTSINLAQLVSDGEQILVARAGAGSSVSAGGPGAGSGGGTSGGSGGAVVDINSGDVTALDSLPGVGPVLAQRILDWRMAHGRFTSVDELDEVSGIGDKLMAEIRPHVRL